MKALTKLLFFSVLLLSGCKAAAQGNYSEPVVYQDDDVVFRKIDDHTWEGNGNLCYNESIYLVEGSTKALLIDVGTKIPNLDKIVASLTDKEIILVATHVHPDHTGSAVNLFDEIWINAGDYPSVATQMKGYKGKISFLQDGQVFDLGGREIEVIFTPGHTPGSTSFFDKAAGYGFSGDAFGQPAAEHQFLDPYRHYNPRGRIYGKERHSLHLFRPLPRRQPRNPPARQGPYPYVKGSAERRASRQKEFGYDGIERLCRGFRRDDKIPRP